MIKRLLSFSFILLLATGSVGQERKRRIAVLDFDFAPVSSSVYSIFSSNVDIGKGIADLIVDKLSSSGVFEMYDRKALEKILLEQNFTANDRTNIATAARIAQLIGVDAIILGGITEFSRDEKTGDVGAVGRVTGRYGIGGTAKKQTKAVVGLTARIVSVDTGEVVVTVTGSGESSRSVTPPASGSSASAAASSDMTSKAFQATVLGEAVTKATEATAKQLDTQVARVSVRTIRFQGLVADVNNGAIVLNIGSKAGVKVGDKIEVSRQGREITDPATGRVIRRVIDRVGEVVITEVDALSATGKFSGSGEAKVGDLAKSVDK